MQKGSTVFNGDRRLYRIASAFKDAMNNNTSRDKKNYEGTDISNATIRSSEKAIHLFAVISICSEIKFFEEIGS